MTDPTITPEKLEATLARLNLATTELTSTRETLPFVDSLKSIHDELLAAHAVALLETAFDRPGTAIFAHYWDEDCPRLIQLLFTEGPCYDTAAEDGGCPEWMTNQQWEALIETERCIVHIGINEEINNHLERVEHENWIEYRLQIHG